MTPAVTAVAAVTAAPPAQERWGRRTWALLFVLSGNMLLDAVEVSVVLVALPTIAGGLGLTPLGAQWAMSGFALGFAALLLVGTNVTARFGRRRTYLGAMGAFGLASLAGGAVGGLAALVAVRAVKGACAALTAPAGLAIIDDAFPEGPARRRAVSVYASFGAIGFTAGLLLAGLLVETGWRWVLVFPAPAAFVLLVCGRRVLPPDHAAGPPRRPRLALLRGPTLRRTALVAASLNGVYQSLLLLVVFTLRGELGWSPGRTALALLPGSVPLVLAVPFAGRLVARFGTARPIALGALFALLAGVVHLVEPPGHPYLATVLPSLLLVQAGFCCAFAPLNMQATTAVDGADRRPATLLYQAGVQLGAGLLLPLVALLGDSGGDRAPRALVVVVGALGLVMARPRPTGAAESARRS